jgi:hypothetical protein
MNFNAVLEGEFINDRSKPNDAFDVHEYAVLIILPSESKS